MARKIKYTRKDLKSPDEFISTLGRATLWAKENRVTVAAAVIVTTLALGGISLRDVLAARAASGSTSADTSVIMLYLHDGTGLIHSRCSLT